MRGSGGFLDTISYMYQDWNCLEDTLLKLLSFCREKNMF